MRQYVAEEIRCNSQAGSSICAFERRMDQVRGGGISNILIAEFALTKDSSNNVH